MNKTRILLASVLKPVNDTRMFEKLGLSLAKLPHAEVHIAGFAGPLPATSSAVHLHPLFRFKRLGWGRALAPWVFLKFLFQLQPAVIIVGTHELLIPALLYKLFRRCRLIYDVRENYFLNLTSQRVYPRFISWLFALNIRLIEYTAAPFLAQFFLAEQSYAHELPFIGRKYLVLENKYKAAGATSPANNLSPTINLPVNTPVQLLYSGTISELYGVFEAVAFCHMLNQHRPGFRLTIIGYCPQRQVLDKLKQLIKDNPAIELIGGEKLVPHEQIVAAIRQSHIGLLPYHPHPSTVSCIPTKLYEYLAHALPVIAQENPAWEKIVQKYNAGIMIDFGQVNAAAILQALDTQKFYPVRDLPAVWWDSEEIKLLQWIQTTIFKTQSYSF